MRRPSLHSEAFGINIKGIEMINLDIMQDGSEIIHYDHAGIPLYIRTCTLSSYPHKRALCHWHDDIELIHVLKGKMNYDINGKCVLLKEDDCLMVNTRQMHYGYASENQDCLFSCILFHPSLLTSNKLLLQKYVTPILENTALEYLYFDSKGEQGREAAKLLKRLVELKASADCAYELETIGVLHIFWSRLLRHTKTVQPTAAPHTDLNIQKDMVSYVYQHYSEKVSLDDIAASGHVSRSKCCLIFKRYLQQSPIEFLNTYRLKVSCRLLTTTSQNITEIALSCGFNHLSYFSKMFLESFQCTPSEYRRKQCHAYKDARKT